MKKWLMATLFGTALVLGACGGDSDDNSSSDNGSTEESGTVDSAAGEQVYKDSCASCHGQQLEGGVGDALDDVGSRLSADEILEIIENGQGTMPGGLVSGDDATAVAEWLAEKQ